MRQFQLTGLIVLRFLPSETFFFQCVHIRDICSGLYAKSCKNHIRDIFYRVVHSSF